VHEPAYEPSQTLVKTDPVHTQPARSEHWDEDDEEHEHHHDHHDHENHDDDDMMKLQGAVKFNSPFLFSDSESLAVWLHPFLLNHITNRQPKARATGIIKNGRDEQ
jgi:hypothetical protein